jgi:tetratricopeptide (TPR) repeat protein
VSVKPADVRALEQYRSLCLLALGRSGEAEEAIANVIAVDPFYLPAEGEAAPRIRAAFQDVRRRLLPDIASERYNMAKATYERKEFAAAVEQFKQVVALLNDPDMQGRLSDLRTLAGGFLDLSVASAKAAEPPKPAVVTPPPPPAPVVSKIYSGEDAGVTPPIAIRQAMPMIPSSIMQQVRQSGILEVLIDEQGRVESAIVRTSIHPLYDSMLLSAAADWRYQPARVNGEPVKFRKRISVAVAR